MIFSSYSKLRSLSTPLEIFGKQILLLLRTISDLSNRRFLTGSIIDLIVFASYYFLFISLSLALAGLFKREFILIGLAVGFLLFLALFWKRIEFNKHNACAFLSILGASVIIFTGVILIKGYFAGMAMNFYLPWAREIVLEGRMPDNIWFLGRFPLMPLFYAGIFSIFGYANWVIASFSFFFAGVTAFLIYSWLLEKGVSIYWAIFGILLLLTSPLFLDVGMHPMQDPFILFFAAAFFYYLEKFSAPSERGSPRLSSGRQKYFLLLFLSAVLASLSKETGLILFLPIAWVFIKNKFYKNGSYFYYLIFLIPLLLWLARNYIIFGNPLFPVLDVIFKSRYYDLVSVVNYISGYIHSLSAQKPMFYFWGHSALARIFEVPASYILMFTPLTIASFYGFIKERKFQYILLFSLVPLFFIFAEPAMGDTFLRYSMPFLALFIIYAIIGLGQIKSRIFLSLIFFFNLWGLFFTPLLSSKSRLFGPVEGYLDSLRNIAQFTYDYNLFLALALSIFFFLFISSDRRLAKHLILLAVFTYFIKTELFNLGSWLNIWLPILSLILIILIWRFAARLNESALCKAIAGWIAALLILNGWGMAGAYFLTHDGFVFPNFAEAYESRPEMADEIIKLEGENRDFYIVLHEPSYFVWYANFKFLQPSSHPFHLVTNLEYKEDMSAQELYRLFKRSKIKYVVYRDGFWPSLEPQLFDKIKSRPDLFELLFNKGKMNLWRVKQ